MTGGVGTAIERMLKNSAVAGLSSLPSEVITRTIGYIEHGLGNRVLLRLGGAIPNITRNIAH